MRVVAKIGTSSITDDAGQIDVGAIDKLTSELAGLRQAGHEVLLVSSGAVAAGVAALGFRRPPDRCADTPGGGSGRPDPSDAGVQRPSGCARPGRCTGAPRSARLRRSIPIPPRPRHHEPADRAGMRPGDQRERRRGERRAAVRRQRPHRGPRRPLGERRRAGAPHRPRRPVHRRSPPRRRRPSWCARSPPTTRCCRSVRVRTGAGAGAAEWRASLPQHGSRRGQGSVRSSHAPGGSRCSRPPSMVVRSAPRSPPTGAPWAPASCGSRSRLR